MFSKLLIQMNIFMGEDDKNWFLHGSCEFNVTNSKREGFTITSLIMWYLKYLAYSDFRIIPLFNIIYDISFIHMYLYMDSWIVQGDS